MMNILWKFLELFELKILKIEFESKQKKLWKI